MKLRLPAGVAALALTAGLAAPASAAVIVSDWNYYFRAGWTNFEPPAGGATPFGVTGDTPTEWSDPGVRNDFLPTRLRWGQTTSGSTTVDPSRQSQLVILPRNQSGPADPNLPLITGGPDLATFDIAHRNFVIFQFDQSLDTASFLTNVTLQPRTPLGDPFTAPTLDFLVNFQETRNADPNCPVSGGPTACSDIFVLGGLEGLTRTIPGEVFGAQFAGVDYIATITLEGLQALPAEACAAAGAEAGCSGFITTENAVNTFTSFFSISAVVRDVPEPTSLALAGAVLLAMGGLSLRRKR